MSELKQPDLPTENGGIKKGVSSMTIYDNVLIPILQEQGLQFGVKVEILKKEGEEYRHDTFDKKTGKPQTYRGTLSKGKSYINISSPKNDLSDFWKAVKTEENFLQNPSSSPKI